MALTKSRCRFGEEPKLGRRDQLYVSMMRGLRLTESWEMTNELRVRSV